MPAVGSRVFVVVPSACRRRLVCRVHRAGEMLPVKKEMYSPRSRKRIFERWEPEKFRRLRSEDAIEMELEIEDEGEHLPQSLIRDVRSMQEELDKWGGEPACDMQLVLRIIAMCVMEPIHWSKENDLLVTRVAVLLLSDVVAHSDGVHRYRQGSFRRIEDIPSVSMVKMESILSKAQIIFIRLKNDNIERTMGAMFQHLSMNLGDVESATRVTSRDLCKGVAYATWAFDDCNGIGECVSQFARRSSTEKIADLLGTWTRVPRPVPPVVSVAFDDCAMRNADDETDKDLRVTQIAKSKDNLCYFGIPMCLASDAPGWVVDELALLLTTSYAAADHGREMDTAHEALSWMDQPTPPVIVMLTGVGGNSKSARTILRNNVFAGHHRLQPFGVLQVNQEFRKQGGGFAFVRYLTIQECNPGVPLLEQEFNKFVSGEFIACRPLFGQETEYYRWINCAKYWELNMEYPSITGDWSKMWELRSMTRRMRVVKLSAVFHQRCIECRQIML